MKKISPFIIFAALMVFGIVGLAYWKYQAASMKQVPPSIALTSPNGGEEIVEGENVPVTWTTKNIPADYHVSLTIQRVPPPPLAQEGQEFDPVVFTGLPNTGSVAWKVSDMYPAGDYLLGITAYASTPITNPISDESDAPFHIAKAQWQTYANKMFGYQIQFPPDWVVREFPDTQDGAGFRPSASPNDIASECITIDERAAAASLRTMPFAEYVKRAAAMEIQNYQTLHSIKPVTTQNRLTGYETTWNYQTLDGQEKVSLPITYFNHPVTMNGVLFKTVQVVLGNQDCQGIYNQMLSTFKLIP